MDEFSAESPVDYRDDKYDDEQEPSDSCRVSDVLPRVKIVKYIIFYRRRGASRPAAGHDVRLHEPALEPAYDAHDKYEERRGAYLRPCYRPELLPAVRPVY